jgi:hypothetical protein
MLTPCVEVHISPAIDATAATRSNVPHASSQPMARAFTEFAIAFHSLTIPSFPLGVRLAVHGDAVFNVTEPRQQATA